MSENFSIKGAGAFFTTKEAEAAFRKSQYFLQATGSQSDTTYYKQPMMNSLGGFMSLDCRVIVNADGSFKIEQCGPTNLNDEYTPLAEYSRDEKTVEEMQSDVKAQAEALTKDKEKSDIGI